MCCTSKARSFGLKERADEKGMGGKLPGADLTGFVETGEAEAGGVHASLVRIVQAIAAAVALTRRFDPENAMKPRTWGKSDGARLIDQRASKLRDDRFRTAWVSFGRVGTGNAGNIAGKFNLSGARRAVEQDDNGVQNSRMRLRGIEPRIPAWKAGVLPLNYSRG
jgi:hypothetical protein